MTPDELFAILRRLDERSERQFLQIKRIGDNIEFLAWTVAIALGLILALAFGTR